MTDIANVISALLYDHNVVIVPGLGAFECQAEGAKVNVITNQFEKPSATLSFNPQRREENNMIVDYLMTHDGISEEDAQQLVLAFVTECFVCLKDGEQVEIPQVGTLSLDGNQEMVFTPVDSNDFNGDAFGLSDIHPRAVYHSESQDDWKQQVGQQIKDINTPMTVDIKHDDDKPKRGWIWVLPLLLVAGGVALWYFKFRPVPPPPVKPVVTDTIKPVEVETDTSTMPLDTLVPETDTTEVEPTPLEMDTVVEPIEEPVVEPVEEPFIEPVEVVKPKAYIVGGCFSIEQNALNMVEETKEMGCTSAFVMKRGSMYYVCYGGFATAAEAKAVLPEVLKQYNGQAWILTK